MSNLDLKLIISGPYSFNSAAAEKVFVLLKNQVLNPDNYPTWKK
jgi:hypothetical protein